MKIIYFISVFCLLMQLNLSAIDPGNSPEYKDSLAVHQNYARELLSNRGIRIYCQKNLLSNQEVIELYKNYPKISRLYSTGYTLAKVGTSLLIVGIVTTSTGFIIAGVAGLGVIFSPGSNAYYISQTGLIIGLAGALLIPISVVLKIEGKSNISDSVKKYNQSQIKSKGITKFEYSFGIVSSGLGLQVRF